MPLLEELGDARTPAVRDRLRAALGEDAARAEDGEAPSRSSEANARRAALLSRLGRVLLTLGEDEDAARTLLAARDAQREAGALTAAVHDAIAAGWVQQQRLWQLGDARRTLASVEELLPELPGARARVLYHRAMLASRLSQLRDADGLLREARALAERFRVIDLIANASLKHAEVLQALGRPEAATEALRAAEPHLEGGCLRAHHAAARGWVALLAAEASGGAAPVGRAPHAALEEALAAYAACDAAPGDRENVQVNLALAAWLRGDLAAAGAHLERAEGATAEVRGWRQALAARVALEGGDAAGALARFDALATRARLAPAPPLQWRAALGRGDALRALGRDADAVEAYRAAEAVLDEEVRALALRGTTAFVGARWTSAARLAEALLEAERPAEAYRALRLARRRALARAPLATEGDAELERAIARYMRARQALEADAGALWEAPVDELAELEAHRRARLGELERALEDAGVQHGGAASDAPLPEAPDDVLRVLVFPHPEGRLVLAARAAWDDAPDARDGSARKPTVRGARLAPGAWPELEDLAEGARRVEVLGAGAEAFARPPLDLPIVHALDLPPRPPRSWRGAGRLVLVDPTGTLDGALREGRALAARQDATLLEGAAATRDRVLGALGGVRQFHYAGHGIASEVHGGALELADGVRLTLVDVLALPRAPARVALNGCDTASAQGLVPVGVAQAFVLAGAELAVGTIAPVEDDEARRFGRALAEVSPDAEAWARVVRTFPDYRVFTR